jgi:hypothetical protein
MPCLGARVGWLAAHDTPGKHVNHKGNVLPALPGADVCEIRHLQLVGSNVFELMVDTVKRTRSRFVRYRGPNDLAPANALQAKVFHQPLERTACHGGALTIHLLPDLVGTIDRLIGLPGGLGLRHQCFIAFGPGAKQFGLAFEGSLAPVARRCGLQHIANRLDPMGFRF